eukprot:scaffold429829_cov49-Prasinocladus_malaysianus.AAC.1
MGYGYEYDSYSGRIPGWMMSAATKTYGIITTASDYRTRTLAQHPLGLLHVRVPVAVIARACVGVMSNQGVPL